MAVPAQALTEPCSALLGSPDFVISPSIRQIQPLVPGAGPWTGQVGGGDAFFCLLKSHLKCNLTSADLCKAKSKCHWTLRTILPCLGMWQLHPATSLFFSSVFPVLISTSALKSSFLFSLSQKICSEIMLGVADHILRVREGSFLFVFYDCVGVCFFSVELPLLASVEW